MPVATEITSGDSRSPSPAKVKKRKTSRQRSKLNISHNLSISDLLTKNFEPEKMPSNDIEVQYYLWGQDLTCSAPDYKWEVSQKTEECEDDLRHILFLKQATLGVNAVKGERNIVQVTSKNHEGKLVTYDLCNLTLDGLEACTLDLALPYDQEVSFKLLKGSGPVHLVGNHYVETPQVDDAEEIEADDTDGEVEDLAEMEEEDEKDLKDGANEDYETDDEKKENIAKEKSDKEEAMED